MRNKTRKVLNRFAFIMTMLMLFTICFGIVFIGLTIKPDLGMGELSSESIQKNNVASAANVGGIIQTPTSTNIQQSEIYTDNCSLNSTGTTINNSLRKQYVFSYLNNSGGSSTFSTDYYSQSTNNRLQSKDSKSSTINHYINLKWKITFDKEIYNLIKGNYLNEIQFSVNATYLQNDGGWLRDNFPHTTFKINDEKTSGRKEGRTDVTMSFKISKNEFGTYLTEDVNNKSYSLSVCWEMDRPNSTAHMQGDLKSASLNLSLADTVKPYFSVDINHTKNGQKGTLVSFNDAGVGIKNIKAHRHILNNQTKEYDPAPEGPYTLYNHLVVSNGAPAGTDFEISPGTQTATWFIPRNVEAQKGFYKYEIEDHLGNKYTIGDQTAFTGVNINFSGGYGTLESPFILSNINDFNELASLTYRGYSFKNAPYFIIDPDNQFNQNSQFINLENFDKQIGADGKPFSGVILGGPKVNGQYSVASIKNLHHPIFGTLKNEGTDLGKISNISVDSGNININDSQIGSVLRHLESGVVENCVNNISVTGRTLVGGIVGYASGGTINNCDNYGAIKGLVGNENDGDSNGLTRVGGIVGRATNNSKITNCNNGSETNKTATITGNSNDIGGICGWASDSTIKSCYNYCEVKTLGETPCVGGILGCASTNDVVEFNINNGKIIGKEWTGGIVGYVIDSTIKNNTNNQTVSATNKAGGIVGEIKSTVANTPANILNNTNTQKISGNNYIAGIVGYAYNTKIEGNTNNKEISGYNYVGGIVAYAEACNVKTNTNECIGDNSAPFIQGNGVVGGIVGISLNTIVYGNKNLKAYIYATGYTSDPNVNFGSIFSGAWESAFVGGIVGITKDENSDIEHCYNSGFVKSDTGSCVGGIVGATKKEIHFCINEANINGRSNVGGIAGASRASARNCIVVNSSINQTASGGQDYRGTILGFYSQNLKVYDCVSINTIKTGSGQGGIDANRTVTTRNTVGTQGPNHSKHIIKGYYYLPSNEPKSVTLEEVTKYEIKGLVYDYQIESGYYFNSRLDTKAFKMPHRLKSFTPETGYVVGVSAFYGALYGDMGGNIVIDLAQIPSVENIPGPFEYTGVKKNLSEITINKKNIDPYIIRFDGLYYNNSNNKIDSMLDAGKYYLDVNVYLADYAETECIVGIQNKAFYIEVTKVDISNFTQIETSDLTYNNANQKPTFKLKWKDGYIWLFEYGGDKYSCSLINPPQNHNVKDETPFKEIVMQDTILANNYTLTIYPKDDSNFLGSKPITFTIARKDIAEFTYDSAITKTTYTGSDIYLNKEIKWTDGNGNEHIWKIDSSGFTNSDIGGIVLKDGSVIKAIDVLYNQDHSQVIAYTATLLGQNNFTGQIVLKLKITPYDIFGENGENSVLTISNYKYGITEGYINTISRQDGKVPYVGEYYNVCGNLDIPGILKFTFSGNSFNSSSTNQKDTLTISGAHALNASSYTLKIEGKDNFTGLQSFNWEIQKREIDEYFTFSDIKDKKFNFYEQGPDVSLRWDITNNQNWATKIWTFEFKQNVYTATGKILDDIAIDEGFNPADIKAFEFEFFKAEDTEFITPIAPIDVGEYVLRIKLKENYEPQNFSTGTKELPTIKFKITKREMSDLTILVDSEQVKLGNSKAIKIGNKTYYYLSNENSTEKSLMHFDNLATFVQHTAVALIDEAKDIYLVIDNTGKKHYTVQEGNIPTELTNNVTELTNLKFVAKTDSGNFSGELGSDFYVMLHDFGSGSGTEIDPYIISNPQEAIRLAELTNGQSFAGAPVEAWPSLQAHINPYKAGFEGIYFAIAGLDYTKNTPICETTLTLNYSDGFRPIGRHDKDNNIDYPFKGSFSGKSIFPQEGENDGIQSYIVLGLADSNGKLNIDNVGLFGIFEGEKLCDIIIEQVIVRGKRNVGAIAGQMRTGNVYGQLQVLSPIQGSPLGESIIEGTANVGGLFGMIMTTAGTTVNTNNYFGKVSSDATKRAILINEANVINSGKKPEKSLHTGGIVGFIEKGGTDVIQVFEAVCQNTGSVTSDSSYVGGLIGYVGENVQINLIPYTQDGKIITNYSGKSGQINDIAGESYVGGLIGYLPITNAYINHVIERAYCLNYVKGNTSNIGGLIGEMNGGKINNCFFLPQSGNIKSRVITIVPKDKNKENWSNVGGLVGHLNGGSITNSLASGFSQRDITTTCGGLVGRKETSPTISDSWVIYAINKQNGETSKQFNSINANDIQYIVVEDGTINALDIQNQIKNIGVGDTNQDPAPNIRNILDLEFVVPDSSQLVFYDLDYEGDIVPSNGVFNTKLVENNEEFSNKLFSRGTRLENNVTKTTLKVSLYYAFLSSSQETIEIGIFREPITFKDITYKTPEEYTTKYDIPLQNNEYYYFTATEVTPMVDNQGIVLSGQVNFNWKTQPLSRADKIIEGALSQPNTDLNLNQGPSGIVSITLSNGETISSKAESKTWRKVFDDLVAAFNATQHAKNTDKTAIYSIKNPDGTTQYYLRDYIEGVNPNTFEKLNVIVGIINKKEINNDPNAPLIIDSQDKWIQFAKMVREDPDVNGFAGRVVKLSGDIVDNLDGAKDVEKKIYVDNDNIAGVFGDINHRFKGTFDGNGKTIYVNLDKAEDATNLSNGLSVFPNAGGGYVTVKNEQGVEESVLEPCKIMNLNIIGNVRSHANINTDSSYDYSGNDVGGKYCAGFVSDPIGYLEITNCRNGANIFGKTDCGGIISHSNVAGNNIKLVDCINAGNIMTTVDKNRHPDSGSRSRTTLHGTGGIIGFIGGDQVVTIDSCKNLGNIRAASNVGGIVGVNNSDLVITNSANEGNIRAQRFPTFKVTKAVNNNAPHLHNYSYIETCGDMDAYIKDYHIDKVSNAGGILGSCYEFGSIKVYASYNSGDITAGCLVAGGIIGSDTIVDTKYEPSGMIVAKSSISVQPKPLEVVTDIKYCYNTGTVAVGSNGKLGAKHKVGNTTQCVENQTKGVNVLDYTCDTWVTREGDDSAGLGGGIIGTSTNTNIDSCYNTGEIISNGSLNATGVVYNIGVGGILGYAFANQNNTGTKVDISYCYSIGNIFLNFYYDYWLGLVSFFHALNDRRYAAPIVGCNATNESNTNTTVSHCFGLKYSVDDPYYGDRGKRYDTTEPGNKDWMRTGILLESLADLTAVMKEDGEIDAPNTTFRQDTESAELDPNTYTGFKNASTSTLINANGTDVSVSDLAGLNGGAYIYPYGCLPQLAVFGLGTETGLSMLSTTYNKNPDQTSGDNYIPQTAGSALSPYLINDGIDLLCLEALTNATGDSRYWTGKGKYISFANGSNNIYGNVSMFIDMPSGTDRTKWFISRNEDGDLVDINYDKKVVIEKNYDKRNTNRRIFTRGAVLGQDFVYEGEATQDQTFNRWRAKNHYFGGDDVANPPVMKKNFNDCKVSKESNNGGEKFLNLFDDNQNTKFYVDGLNNSNHKISFKIDIGRSANLTGFSWVTGNDTSNHPGRNPNHITIYGSDDAALYENSNFEITSWGNVLYDSNIEMPQDNKATRGFTVGTPALARYYLIIVTVPGDDFQASEFNMSFDIKHDTSGTVYPNEPFANLIDSDKYSKFYQEGRYFNVKARANSECYLNEITFITGNNNASLERVLEHLAVYGAKKEDIDKYNSDSFDATGWTEIFNGGISMPAKNHFTCVYPINSTEKFQYYLIRGTALNKASNDDHRGFQAHDMQLKFSSDASMTKTNMYSISKREGHGFEGTLDGAMNIIGGTGNKKVTIENIYMTNNHLKDLGLFSVLNGGTIKNMAMTGYVKSSYASTDVNDIADVGAYVGLAINGATINGLDVGRQQKANEELGNAVLIASSIIANNNHVGGVVGHVRLEKSGVNNQIKNINVLNGIVSGNINAQIAENTEASSNIESGGLGGVVGFASEHVIEQAGLGDATAAAPKLTFDNINVDRMTVWAMSKGANHIGGILGNHSKYIGLVFNEINIGDNTKTSPMIYSNNDLTTAPIVIAGEYAVGGLTSWTNDGTSITNVNVYGDVGILRTSNENTDREGLKTHNQTEIGTAIGGLIGYSLGETVLGGNISSYVSIDISETNSNVKNIGGVVGVASKGIGNYQNKNSISFNNVNLDVEVNINGNMTKEGIIKSVDDTNIERKNIGGLVGKVTDAFFDGTFNIRPSISANQFENVGGFIGHSKGNVYASVADINAQKVINIGKIINEDQKSIEQSAIIGKENVGGFIGKNNGKTYVGAITIGANDYKGVLTLNNHADVDGKKSVGGIIGLNAQDAVFSTGHDNVTFGKVTCYINNNGKIGTKLDSLGVGTGEILTDGYIGGIVGQSVGNNTNSQTINLDFKTYSELSNQSFVGIKELSVTENGKTTIKHHSDAFQTRVGGILGSSAGTINVGGKLINQLHGNIFGYSYVGGSIGELLSGTVTGNLVNDGNVTGVKYVGGNIGAVASEAVIKNNGKKPSEFENNVSDTKDEVTNRPTGGNVNGTEYDNTISKYTITKNNEYIGGSIGLFKGAITKDVNVEGQYGVKFVNTGGVSGFAKAGGSIGELAGRVNSAAFITTGQLTFVGYHELGGSIGSIVNNGDVNHSTMMRDSRFEYISTNKNKKVNLTAGSSLNGKIAPSDERGGIGGVIGLIYSDEINDVKVDDRYKWENNSFYINGNVYAPGCYDVGGVVGRIENSYVNITNMLAFETTVTGYNNVGGIVGYNGSTNNLTEDLASLVDCYNIEGTIAVEPKATGNVNIGGIVGQSVGNTTYSCYWFKGFPNAELERIDINNLGSQLTSQFNLLYEFNKLQNDAYYTQAKEEMKAHNENGLLWNQETNIYNFGKYIEEAQKDNSTVTLYDNAGNAVSLTDKTIVESNGDYGYYEASQPYTTGTQETGFFCVYSNDAKTLGIGDIRVQHTINDNILVGEGDTAVNNDEAAWKKIANAYASDESSDVPVKSDLLYDQNGVVNYRHFYATGTTSTVAKDGKNGYFLYGAVSGTEGQVNERDNKFFFDADFARIDNEGTESESVVQAKNIVLFYKKVKFEFSSLNYNGLDRIAPVSFNYRNQVIKATTAVPSIDNLKIGDYYILLSNPAGEQGVFNVAKDATEVINTYGNIYYVNSKTINDDKTVGIKFGVIDSRSDAEYQWSIKPRKLTTSVKADNGWTLNGGTYSRTYDGSSHGITFSVTGGISGEGISGTANGLNDSMQLKPIVGELSGTKTTLTSAADTAYTVGYPKTDENGQEISKPIVEVDTYTFRYDVKLANQSGQNYQFKWSYNPGKNVNYKKATEQTINLHINKAQLVVAGWTKPTGLIYADETLPQITGIKIDGKTDIIPGSNTENNKVTFTYDGKSITININRVGKLHAGDDNIAKAEIGNVDMPNYEFKPNDPNIKTYFSIGKATISKLGDLALSSVTKEYDGNNKFDLNTITKVQSIKCESNAKENATPTGLKFTISEITFDDKNVGTNKTVTIKGTASFDDPNFVIDPQLLTNKTNKGFEQNIGVITAHKVTITANYFNSDQKQSYVYDGNYHGLLNLKATGLNGYDENLSQIVTLTLNPKLVTSVASTAKDTITMKTDTASTVLPQNTDKYSVTIADNSNNFEIECPNKQNTMTWSWKITPAAITISGITGVKKVYDSTDKFVVWENGAFKTKTGKGSFDVNGRCKDDNIRIEATYFEQGREAYNSFVNGVKKDGEKFIIDKSLNKGLKFVMSGNDISNYTLTGATANDPKTYVNMDCGAKITPVQLVVTYSNTFQSYINANGALKTKDEYLPVNGTISNGIQGEDSNKIEVVMLNNWLPEGGFKKDTIIVDRSKLDATIGPAGGDTLGVCKNYEISNKPVLTIAYYIQESGAEKVSSLSGLIMASYYYSLNFLGDGTATQLIQEQTITVGYNKDTQKFYYPVNDPIVEGTAGEFNATQKDTFAYQLYKHLTKSLGENNETIIDGSSITIPSVPAESSVDLIVNYKIKFTPSPKKEFILVKDISGKMTDKDLEVLDGRFNANWGRGTTILSNVERVGVGETIVFYDSLFKDTFVGAFNGNNYVIKDIIIQSSENATSNIGLFSSLAMVTEKTVQNADQQDTTITVKGAGTINSLHLRNVNIRVMSNAPINVGGIIGYVHKDITKLENLSFVGDARINTSGALNYGGIIGAYEGASATTTVDTQSSNGLLIDQALVIGRVRTNSGVGSNIGAIAGKMETGALKNVLEMVEVIHTGAESNVNLFEGSGKITPDQTTKVTNIKNSMVNNGALVSKDSGSTYTQMRTASTHIDYANWAKGEYGSGEGKTNLGNSDVLVLATESKDVTNGYGYPRQSTTFRDIVDVYLLGFELIEKETTTTTTEGEKPITTTSHDYEFGDSNWVTVVKDENGNITDEYININNKQKLALVKLLWFANFKVTVSINITSDDLEFNSEINEVFVGSILSVNSAKITHYDTKLFRYDYGVTDGIVLKKN